MKLDAKPLRYLTGDDLRVLTAVTCGPAKRALLTAVAGRDGLQEPRGCACVLDRVDRWAQARRRAEGAGRADAAQAGGHGTVGRMYAACPVLSRGGDN